MGGVQIHRIGSRRLVYKGMVGVWSKYKKPYFCWYGNLACGDSAESNRIEKDKYIVYLLDFF